MVPNSSTVTAAGQGGPENPPAFPSADERDAFGCDIREGSSGMSLRDWFAGQAAGGLLACPTMVDGLQGADYARLAYGIADAMLAERAKGGAA